MGNNRLINAANLHVGGAVQVVSSFLWELSQFDVSGSKLSIVLSSEVAKAAGNLEALRASGVEDVREYDIRGFDFRNWAARDHADQFSTVFTLFGPLYRWRPPFKSIVGFAQPWIIYPNNEVYSMLRPMQRFKTRIKYWIQSIFFKRSDVIVVELDHVKEGLVRELGIDPAKIHVIRNCVSSIYSNETLWQSVNIPPLDSGLKLGFVGRNHLHKNTAVFPEIISKLRERYGIVAKFYVTFSDEEWRGASETFRESCINVGPLVPSQCPRFYQAMDAVVFPSLLECFSATPLEAMAMEKPLFASDRAFNRDVCGNHAIYFDPLSAEDAAKAIAEAFEKGKPDRASLIAARDHAFSFSSPAERAQRYLDLFEITESQRL